MNAINNYYNYVFVMLLNTSKNSVFSGPPKNPPKWPKIVDFDPFQKTEGGDTSKRQKWPILAILPIFGLYGVDHNFRPDLAISENRHVRGTPPGPRKSMIFDVFNIVDTRR